jgi:hypothetical protein
VKVLSLTQPWATLMAIGEKKIETRSWRPRGAYCPFPLAIAASAGFPADCQDFCYVQPFRNVLHAAGYLGPSDLPTGCILAVVDVVECPATEDLLHRGITRWERDFGDYRPRRYGWVTANLRRLPKPLRFSGGQGLTKDIPDDVIARALAGEAVRA